MVGVLSALAKSRDVVIARLVQVLAADTVSTAFSGIDAPGVSYGVIGQAISDLLFEKEGVRLPPPAPQHLNGVERDSECISELLTSPHGPDCLFTDINCMWADPIKRWIDKVSKQRCPGVADALTPAVMSGRACKRTAWCARHKRMCEVRAARTHYAGTPCVDESSMGSMGGALDGRSGVSFLCWLAQRRMHQDHSRQNSIRHTYEGPTRHAADNTCPGVRHITAVRCDVVHSGASALSTSCQLPCPDGQGRGTGVCWLALLLGSLPQEETIVQENVKAFPTGYLTHFLGDLYEAEEIVLNSCSLGWPGSRTRT